MWPSLEFPDTLLPGRGLRREYAPAALWANAGSVVGLVGPAPRLRFVRGAGPGWSSSSGVTRAFPAGLAAVLTRVPRVGEHRRRAGRGQWRLGRFAAANAVAFAGTDLPRTHVTGTPVRPELASLDRTPEGRASSRDVLGLPPDRQTVASVGGSLGSLRVNRAVAELAETWAILRRPLAVPRHGTP